MHNKIKPFIQFNQMIQEGDELILGVSGGADSMLLLYYFYQYQKDYHVTLKVAHVHHGLREEAHLDTDLVEQFCKQRQIPFFKHYCFVQTIAKQKKISEEEAGREERYQFFQSLAHSNSKIVTAHHMNDQAETVLMHLIRGSGIKGLGGISPNRGAIIRPFLCLTRLEIESYCKLYQVPYREDSTNQEVKYTRNKVRLQLLPFIEETINESAIKTIARTGMMCQEASEFIEAQTVCYYKESCERETAFQIELNHQQLVTYPLYMQKCVLLYAIKQLTGMKDYTSSHIESCIGLLNGQVGKKMMLPNHLSVIKDYQQIRLIKNQLDEKKDYCQTLKIGSNLISDLGLNIEITIDPLYLEDETRYTKVIDCAKIKQDLCIRTRRTADYMTVPGGHKKLNRIMIDDKIPAAQRDHIPLIADGHEIIWIIGYRLSTHYYITKQTKKILEIKLNKLEKLS